jgi:hypothetical protein
MKFAAKNLFKPLARVALIVAFNLLGPIWALGQDRIPVPAQAEQQESLKQIKDVFKGAYRDRSPAGTRARVEQFLKTGLETQDSTSNQFVLLELALQGFVDLGDVDNALKACEGIAERFDVDAIESRVQTLNDVSRNLGDLQAANEYLSAANQLAEQFIANDNYPAATSLLDRMQSVARKGKMQYWSEGLKTKSRRISKISKGFKNLADDFELLESDPEHVGANQKVGRFYCFQKDDFATGLELLAKGDDESPDTAIAKNELAASNTEQQLEVADLWWDLSKDPPSSLNLDDPQVSIIQKHAAQQYKTLVDETTGLIQKRIEERLTEFNLANGGEWLKTLTGKTWRIAWSGQSNWDEVRFSRKGMAAITLEKSGEVKEYAWSSISETEILVNGADVNRSYIISMSADGTLQGKRFNTKTGNGMGEGSSRPLLRE